MNFGGAFSIQGIKDGYEFPMNKLSRRMYLLKQQVEHVNDG
jgi:hypothetical protein